MQLWVLNYYPPFIGEVILKRSRLKRLNPEPVWLFCVCRYSRHGPVRRGSTRVWPRHRTRTYVCHGVHHASVLPGAGGRPAQVRSPLWRQGSSLAALRWEYSGTSPAVRLSAPFLSFWLIQCIVHLLHADSLAPTPCWISLSFRDI